MTISTVFKVMVFSLAGMVLVFLLVGQILADQWQVETVRSVPGPPDRVAALVGDFATWPQWASIEVQLGAPTERSLAGEPRQVGHQTIWTGPLGRATMTLTAVTPSSISYQFVFQSPGQPAPVGSSGSVTWIDEGSNCRVTWHEGGTWANLPARWFGWFGALQDSLRQKQGASLEGLAAKLAGGAAGKG